MDHHRFDSLARSLTTTGSRRRALLAALGAALGTAVGTASVEEAAAKKKCPPCKKRKKGKCKGKKPDGAACPSGTCQSGSCVTIPPPAALAAPPPPPPPPPPPGSPCTPNCAGKECGNDGCGGSCGPCTGGSCSNGSCFCAEGAWRCDSGECVAACASGTPVHDAANCSCCTASGDLAVCSPTFNTCCSGICDVDPNQFVMPCLGRPLGATCQFNPQCGPQDFCAQGQCVVGQGSCAAGADHCASNASVDCGSLNECLCYKTFDNVTRCGRVVDPGCGTCGSDQDCEMRRPDIPGAFCARETGGTCNCIPEQGFCAAPCQT